MYMHNIDSAAQLTAVVINLFSLGRHNIGTTFAAPLHVLHPRLAWVRHLPIFGPTQVTSHGGATIPGPTQVTLHGGATFPFSAPPATSHRGATLH